MSSTPIDWVKWGAIGQCVAALLTFGAVVVAVYQDRIWRPRLRLHVSSRSPRCMKQDARVASCSTEGNPTLQKRVPCYYIRVTIENHGELGADHVEVMLKTIEECHNEAGEPLPREDFCAINLGWTHRNHNDAIEASYLHLPPHTSKECDLACIVRRDPTEVPRLLELQVVPKNP